MDERGNVSTRPKGSLPQRRNCADDYGIAGRKQRPLTISL